jgi:predicted lipid-binding transport protein (Tim44 family)
MFRNFSYRSSAALVAGVLASALMIADVAQAKVGGGSSSGSRGSHTYSAPPATNTAPKAAAPMERSQTSPSQAQASRPGAATAAAATAAKPSMFGGMKGLLLGGLIAGGLASMFGVGALANVLGFALQAALIGGIVFLAYNWFRNRRGNASAPAMATASNLSRPQPVDANAYRASAASIGGSAPPLAIKPDDFSTFERLLGEIQLAYGRNDVRKLGDHVTPEMLSYFAGDLDTNAKKGVRNEITDPKLLQGDLSEAWREGSTEYATVAMRFSLLDRMVDASSGRVISGSTSVPTESTELWTFRRPLNGQSRDWELSAIQQAA